MTTTSRLALSSLLMMATLCGGLTHAADTPPIKPGLWEVSVASQQIDGQAMPDMGSQMAEQLKSLPPEMRKQMEAHMKAKGVQMSPNPAGGTSMRNCVSKESLDHNRWQGAQGDCTNQITSRSGNTWKWKVTCTKPPSQGEGTTVFVSPEAYTNDMRMTIQQPNGKPQVMTMKHRAKWISSDCGSLKPIMPPVAK